MITLAIFLPFLSQRNLRRGHAQQKKIPRKRVQCGCPNIFTSNKIRNLPCILQNHHDFQYIETSNLRTNNFNRCGKLMELRAHIFSIISRILINTQQEKAQRNVACTTKAQLFTSCFILLSLYLCKPQASSNELIQL